MVKKAMKRNGCFFVSNTCWLIVTLALLSGGSAFAVSEEDKYSSIYNKIKLLDWLVNDSPVTKRIEASDDDVAKQQLQRSREMLQQAVEHNEQGEYELAEGHINQGLVLMTKLSRKVKDEDRVKQARIELYKQVKGHVDMFVVAFDRVAEEKGEEHVRGMLDRDELDQVMSKAESAYEDGDLAMANHLMRQAADIVDNALSDARHKDVLLHELKFESLEEEYAYEINRNESYVKLIDLMQKKSAPSQASAAYVQKLIDENSKLREQADMLVSEGKLEQGISVMESGTDKLSRALRVSGASF
jgi:hypothetical protein